MYERAIPRLTAHRIIRSQQENSYLEPENVYNLWLLAYQDKELASKMQAQAAMNRGINP
jgi:hypothetical protein